MVLLYLILILIAGFGVLNIVGLIRGQKECPSDRDLENYLKGKINKSGFKADKIVGHLGICEKCQERMTNLL